MSKGADLVESFAHGGATLVAETLRAPDSANPADAVNLVFLHGWGGSRDSLRGIALLFQHSHRVHLIDLPGFGQAPMPPEDWGTSNYTDLVQAYLQDRVAGASILVGHSFGSRLAIRIAARRPPRIRAAVLMAAPGLPMPGFSRSRLRRSAIRALRRVLIATKPVVGQRAIDWHTRRYGSKDYLAASGLRAVLVRTVNEDLTDSARAIACPVLLVWGSDDTETPPWLGERYRELMHGHGTLVTLPHKDHHSLYSGTGAHLCAFKIRSWLEQVGRAEA